MSSTVPETKPVIVVTGASSGIGAATVRLLALQQPRLVLHARAGTAEKAARLHAVARTAAADGAEVEIVTGDLAIAGTGQKVIETALTRFGKIDQLVANAGFADRRQVSELTRADFDRSYAAMAGALLEMAQQARASLMASPRGRIVFVSSFVAHRFAPESLFPASAAAKAAAEALVRSLAAELAAAGVAVNTVVPGYTRKDSGTTAIGAGAWTAAEQMTPMRRLGEPADVAALIAFLLSDAARHITGQSITVDGGLSLL